MGSRALEHVKFATQRSDLPLPSPRYPTVFCRVAHMPGAVDYYRDLYDGGPFAEELQRLDPARSDFPAALNTCLFCLSEQSYNLPSE